MWWAALLNSFAAVLDSGGAGGGGSFESIATFTAAGGETSLTFSSIPSTYKHLQIRGLGRDALGAAGAYSLGIQFNADTGTNYSWHNLVGDGSSASAGSATTTAQMYLDGALMGNTVAAGIYSVSIIDIIDYASTTKNKTLRGFSGGDKNAAGNSMGLSSGLWRNTSAVTSIKLIPVVNFISGSTFALYGIKGA
jgi:hypothetical protein